MVKIKKIFIILSITLFTICNFSCVFADEIYPIPDTLDNYNLLEYIESTGTQYIDTGVQMSNKIRFDLDLQFTDISSSNNQVNGHFGNSGSNVRCQFGIISNQWSFGIGSIGVNNGIADTNRHKIIIDCLNKIAIFDDITQGNHSDATFSGNSFNLGLFARRGSSIFDSKCNMKLYSSRIYNNEILIRDFIPVKNKQTNEIGLFDKVENKFYVNNGTGDFIGGPVITDPDNPSDNPQITIDLSLLETYVLYIVAILILLVFKNLIWGVD